MIFDPYAFGAGALNFGLAFLAAGGFTLIFKAIYQVITPHNEGALIRAGNSAAAVALGGAILGYLIPLASALAHTDSLPEFIAWAALAGLIQIIVFWAVRRMALPDISARIERGEISAAIYLLTISLAVGIINAACMTA
jgi:putative membrane protein